MKNNFTFYIPNNKRDSKYIGFDFEKDNSVFIFPCQYLDENVNEKTKKSEARKIMSLLKKVQKDYIFGGKSDELYQFYSMIWLIQDFINRGYYSETENISKISTNGRINWKQTIKNNSILFDNGNIIYKDIVRNKNIINESQIITQIYKCCLSYSVERLGFIFGIDSTEKSIFDMDSKDKEMMIYYLNTELHQTFLDYKKQLLQHLLTIITNKNDKNKDIGYSIYDAEFEYVFEFLINKVFGNENVTEYYNKYEYHIFEDNKEKTYSASHLRPDTIMKKDDINYYIIDAKYYNFGYTKSGKDLPQSSSISKQIGYNHYVRDLLKEKLNADNDISVKSIFLLPFASKTNEYIKYIGYASSDKITDKNHEDSIAICLIDLKELINTYLGYSHNISIESLIEVI